VVGVSRPPGIGRATALRLLARGMRCVCADVVAPAGAAAPHTGVAEAAVFRAVTEELQAAAGPGQVEVVALDPAPDWTALVGRTLERFGRLDVLCALSGASGTAAGDGPLLQLGSDAWSTCLRVNLTDPFRLAQAAARAMVDGGRGGAVVLLSSEAARHMAPGAAALGAARAGLGLLVEALAAELGPHGIRVNAVCPLGVEPTPEFPNPGLVALAEREAGALDRWAAQRIPLGRLQVPDETAAVLDFLCSDAASFVSGTVVPVTGGGR
jgi:NAD(P)-dependent dehydrogenase (short-subunit alcohol dehydrogenase family)